MIFTFDGDAAGQKAALRAFGGDQNFVVPDLRRRRARRPGPVRPADQAGRRRGARAGRPAGAALPLRARPTSSPSTTSTAPTAGSTRCARRPGWSSASATSPRSTRSPASSPAWSASTSSEARAEVRRARPAARPDRPQPDAGRGRGRRAAAARPRRRRCPTCATRGSRIERETLKLVVQHPTAVGRTAADVGANDFTHPTYRAVWELVAAAGGTERRRRRPGLGAAAARRRRPTRRSSSAISALGVEPLLTAKEPDAAYVAAHVFRLQELTALRRIAELKSRLQRTNPVEHADGVQPDVRRAGRARAAPAHAARARDGHAREAVPAHARPRRRRGAAGSGCWPGPRPTTARSLAGTRDALYLGRHRGCRGRRSRPPTGTATPTPLRVVEVGTWGEPRAEHRFASPSPGRLLELVRERVTASVVLQRHVPVRGRAGVRVIARRAPARRPARSPGSTSTTRASTPTTRRRAGRRGGAGAARDEVGLR